MRNANILRAASVQLKIRFHLLLGKRQLHFTKSAVVFPVTAAVFLPALKALFLEHSMHFFSILERGHRYKGGCTDHCLSVQLEAVFLVPVPSCSQVLGMRSSWG